MKLLSALGSVSGDRRLSAIHWAVFALIALWSLPALAAAEPSGPSASLAKAAALLGPLAISPFLALGGLGIFDLLDLYQLPAGLSAFAHPIVIVLMLVAGLALQSGRSAKLTKPFAEAAGLGESAFALIAAFALALPFLGNGSGPVEAGLLEGILFMTAAATCVAALVVLRTALDVLIWLSPIPFVDATFQTVKLGITVLLLVAAVLAPPVAIALNALILIATFLLVRWSIRAARFGLTIAYDLTLGRRSAAAASLPRDEVIDGDLGPFTCFALQAPGLPRRAPAAVDLRAGRWFLVGAGPGGPTGPDTPLGDGDKAVLTPTWAGLELTVGESTVLLPPRYRRFAEQIRLESRAQLGERPRWVPNRKAMARAQPSTL